MSITIQPGGGILLTLEVGQGPAGPSTVAAQAAQALAEIARDEAQASAMAAAASEANVNTQEMFAQDWASKLAAPVEGVEYSAKENAIGATVPTGSAKRWASGSGVIAEGLFSAKRYSENALASQNIVENLYSTFVSDIQPLIPAWIFPTYEEARNAYIEQTKPIVLGDVILVLRDSRFGNVRTYNRADDILPAISFDFANNAYNTSDALQFLSYAGLNLVDVPATSTSFGFLGAFAIDANFLYVGIGNNSWKRISLGAF